MAGYLFNLGPQADLAETFMSGVYSTFLSEPPGYWRTPHEATFADYATMEPGQHVYLFQDRVVYGVGQLVATGSHCRYQNFPQATEPHSVEHGDVADSLLWDSGPESVRQRWLCTFAPAPHFFRRGVDMDDLLSSNPAAFRMLRANWKVSFIKFDDEEDQAFLDALLRANEDVAPQDEADEDVVFPWSESAHQHIAARATEAHHLSAGPLMGACANGTVLGHEMAIEAGILFQLAEGEVHTTDVFGEWPYLSHQVMASPFKPIDWADKMDLFGQAPIPGHPRTVARYLVGEVKKDVAQVADVQQVMKYVDWVKDQYAHGDYSMVRAFLVAHDFAVPAIQQLSEVAERAYTVGRRPPKTARWNNLHLVRYRYDASIRRLRFERVA